MLGNKSKSFLKAAYWTRVLDAGKWSAVFHSFELTVPEGADCWLGVVLELSDLSLWPLRVLVENHSLGVPAALVSPPGRPGLGVGGIGWW